MTPTADNSVALAGALALTVSESDITKQTVQSILRQIMLAMGEYKRYLYTQVLWSAIVTSLGVKGRRI